LLYGGLFVALTLAGVAGLDTRDAQDVRARLSGPTLRRFATFTVSPVYPAASLRRGSSGVAVVELSVLPSGTVERADVLEAPDSYIANAVRKAVRQWKFRLPEPMTAKSRLAFYFSVENGQGKVLTPEQASHTAIFKHRKAYQ
jgi:TonB family protein